MILEGHDLEKLRRNIAYIADFYYICIIKSDRYDDRGNPHASQ